MKTLPLFLGILLLAPLARADSRGRDERDHRRGEPRVIVYEHANFRGGSLVFYPGDSFENLSDLRFENGGRVNDSISSLQVENGAEVQVFEDPRYRGQGLRLTENVRDLTGRFLAGSVSVSWNDRISSLKVERARGRDGGRPGVDPEKMINAAFQDILGRNADPGELRDFRSRVLDQDWNERMLRDHLRTEERYRIEAADRIIRRAYHDVLGRDADPGGLRTYRKNLLDRNWTESDVRDDLRKSAEYHSKHR